MCIINLNPNKQIELTSLAVKVNNLQIKCDQYEYLLGEIINTLNLPHNDPHLHPKLKEMAEIWTVRYNNAKSISTQS